MSFSISHQFYLSYLYKNRKSASDWSEASIVLTYRSEFLKVEFFTDIKFYALFKTYPADS